MCVLLLRQARCLTGVPVSDYPMERERRWLVKLFDLEVLKHRKMREITQGYFDVLGERSFRVRVLKDQNGEEAVVTLKEGMGEVRTEREEPIELPAARIMLDATSFRVEKRRYYIEGWELDIFEGPLDGIVLLEYESKGDEPFPELPSWIHDAIDVTDSLTNLHLARMAKELSGDVEVQVARFLEPKLLKIVLTGGPCSGKSTLMREIEETYGDYVHCVPEVATILISQVGIHPDANDEEHNARFQKILYRVQRSFEEAAELQALKDGKKAIVLDRGTLDAVAYMHGVDGWKRQVRFTIATGLSASDELKRYEQVIYLAPPTREVYEAARHNNSARSESYEQAVMLAERTREAWHVHGEEAWSRFRFKIVDGKTWNEKRDAAMETLKFFLPT